MPIGRDPSSGKPEHPFQEPGKTEVPERQEAETLAAVLGQPDVPGRESLPTEAKLIEAVSFLRALEGGVARGILINIALEHPEIGRHIEQMAYEVVQQKREQRKDIEVDTLLEEAKRKGCHPS